MVDSALRYRPPGLYREGDETRFTPLRLPETGVPGFIGIAKKGPTNVPVRITSYDHFCHVFGTLEIDSFLAPTLHGFFRNGGKLCYVVRVANISSRGSEHGARYAGSLLQDLEGQTSLQITAMSEGSWGNDIRVCIQSEPPRAETLLTTDLMKGSCRR